MTERFDQQTYVDKREQPLVDHGELFVGHKIRGIEESLSASVEKQKSFVQKTYFAFGNWMSVGITGDSAQS